MTNGMQPEVVLRQLQEELHQLERGSQYEVPVDDETALLGSGAFGVVFRAIDLNSTAQPKRLVAIKKVLKETLGREHLAEKTLRELQVLAHFNHPNIVALVDIIKPHGDDFDYVFIVTEHMDFDFDKLLQPDVLPEGWKFQDDHFQYFAYQLLLAVHCIHTSGVIHRDIKPANILVNTDNTLKLADFGLSRADDQNQLTQYVVTRWYRAPEVICTETYGKGVDIWAVGCVLAELITGRPLFRIPSQSRVGKREQLKHILAKLGTPPESDIMCVTSERVRECLRSTEMQFPHRSITEYFPNGTNPMAMDLIGQMLQFNPANRITADAALHHPYLCGYFADTNPAYLACYNQHSFPGNVTAPLDYDKWQSPQCVAYWKAEIAKFVSQYQACKALPTHAHGNLPLPLSDLPVGISNSMDEDEDFQEEDDDDWA